MLFLLRLLALALFIYSVSLVFTSNFNMGNLLVWLLTAAVDVYAIWQQPIHHWLHGTIPGKIVFVFLLVFGILYAALLGFVAFSGYANPATGQEKVVTSSTPMRPTSPRNWPLWALTYTTRPWWGTIRSG